MKNNRTVKTEWFVGEKGVKITMLQVQPGTENKVYRTVHKHLARLKAETKIGHYHIYKVFGHYDLLIVYECKGLASELLFEGTIQHILDSNEIFCFSWERNSGFSFKLNEKNLIGIIFFKVKPEISKQFGVEIEKRFAEHIFKSGISKNITFLGGLGWNEFVVLIHKDTFKGIFGEITALSQTLIRFEKERAVKLALKTYTVIGGNYKLFLSDKLSQSAFGGQPFGNDISISLSITCKPQNVSTLTKALQKTFNTQHVYFAIGKTDIKALLSEKSCKDWADFIGKLRKFRAKNTGLLASTSTEISIKTEEEQQENLQEERKFICVNLTKKDISNIRKFNYAASEFIIGAIYVYNSLIQNEFVRDCFYDLLPFMLNIRKRYTSTEAKALEKKLDRLRFGIDQRSYGTFISLEGAEGRFFPFKGGIQRILLSAEVLPKTILARLNTSWPGFLIVGYDYKYLHHDEILNLPLDLVFVPHEWWGLFHEIGHVYFDLSYTINYDDAPIATTISTVVGIPKKEWKNYSEYIKLLSELAADVFDYELCFLGKFELYVRSVWGYLLREIRVTQQISKKSVQLADYLLRTLFVYIYAKSNDGKHKTKDLKYSEINKLFTNDFIPLLKKIVPEFSDRLNALQNKEAFLEEISIRFAHVKWFSTVLKQKFSPLEKKFEELRKTFNNKRLISQVQSLEKGRVLPPTQMMEPMLLLLKLKERESKQSFRSQVATILSLWNYYVSKFSIS